MTKTQIKVNEICLKVLKIYGIFDKKTVYKHKKYIILYIIAYVITLGTSSILNMPNFWVQFVLYFGALFFISLSLIKDNENENKS